MCVVLLDDNTDLVHSPDDSGWYFQQEFDSQGAGRCERISIIYSDKSDALAAYRDGTISWD